MAGAYTDAELEALEEIGERRTAEHLFDIKQLHLSNWETR